jgi:hypothetical protein
VKPRKELKNVFHCIFLKIPQSSKKYEISKDLEIKSKTIAFFLAVFIQNSLLISSSSATAFVESDGFFRLSSHTVAFNTSAFRTLRTDH